MSLRLVLIAGVAGSGKNYIGRYLLKLLTGYAYLDKDTMTRPFTEAFLRMLSLSGFAEAHTVRGPHDRESRAYQMYVRHLEYECLVAQALENIYAGISIIATAPFIVEVKSASFYETTLKRLRAANPSAKLKLIWVYTTPSEARENLIDRGAERDRWKLDHWQEYLKMVDHNFKIPSTISYHMVDNSSEATDPLQEQLERAKAYIES